MFFAVFFETECSIERVRGASQLGFDADAWSRLAETGAPGMCLLKISEAEAPH